MSIRRKIAGVLLALVAVVLLSGCEVKAELVLKDDGSGTFTYVVGIDHEFLAKMEPGADPLGTIKANASRQSYKVTVTDYETDKLKGIKATFDFSSVDDLKQKLASSRSLTAGQAGQEAAAASAFTFDVLDLSKAEDGWKLTANAGVNTQANQQLPFSPEDLKKLLDASVSATLPGHAGKNNATKVSESSAGTTFTWDVLAGAGNLALAAETTSTNNGFLVAALAIPVVILGAGALVFLVRWKSRSS
jgi:hypothetical protein